MTTADTPTILDELLEALRADGPERAARQILAALTRTLEAAAGWIRPWNQWTVWAAAGAEPPAEARLTPAEAEQLRRGWPLVLRLPDDVSGPATAHWARLGFGAVVVVPLPGEDEPVGLVTLLYPGAPPPDVAERAARLAPLAGLVLQRARTARELSLRERLLAALHRIDRALLAGRPLADVAAEAAEAARALLGAQGATVTLIEGERRRIVAARGPGVEPLVNEAVPLAGPFAAAAQRAEPVWWERRPDEPAPWLLTLTPYTNGLVLPLRPDGETTGFLAVFGVADRAPAERWGPVLAAQVALALWRERQIETLERELAEREALLATLEALREADRPEGVLDALDVLARTRIGADRWALLRAEGDRLRVVAAGGGLTATFGLELGPGQGVSWAAAAGAVVRVTDAATDPRLFRPGIGALRGPELFLPLRTPSGAVLGALALGWPRGTEVPQALAEAFAQTVAMALVRTEAELEGRLLLQAALAVTQAPDLDALLERFVAHLADLVPAGRAGFIGHPFGGHPWRLLAVAGLDPAAVAPIRAASFDLAQERWTAWVTTHGRPLVLGPDAPPPGPPGPLEARGLELFPTGRLLGVPVGDFGVVYVQDAVGRRPFTPLQIALAERLAGMLEDALQRHRLEEGFARLARLRPDGAVLDRLVADLAEVLGADSAFVGLLEDGGTAVRLQARVGLDLERYALAGTPCADVADGAFCTYEHDVAALFPEDPLLADAGVEGYCGMPLRRADGVTLGILVALFRRPRRLQRPALQALFETFARRAEAELEREQRLARLAAVAEAHARLRPANTLADISAEGRAALAAHLGVVALRVAARTATQEWREFWRQGTPPDEPPIVRPLRAPDGQVLGELHVWGPWRAWNAEDWAFLEAVAEAMGAAHARTMALERARHEAERFRALADFSAHLETLEDPDRLLELALRQLVELTGAEAALFAAPDAEGRPEVRRVVLRPGAMPPGSLPPAWREAAAAALRGEGPPTAALVPRGAGAAGAVAIVGPVSPDVDPAPLVAFVARRLGHAWAQADALETLRRTREEALRALGWALEFRDLETKGHTDRVTDLALRLADLLGLDETAQRHLRWGAYLHDIGKLAVPDQVLLKPERLTPEEWAIMREHPVRGEELARRLGFLPEPVLQLIRHHHERWDGSGYPDGLAGEAIPLLARVFAVADVYDALVSPRPYKRAWTHAEAVAELRAQAGRQFDPTVVDAFLSRWTEASPFS